MSKETKKPYGKFEHCKYEKKDWKAFLDEACERVKKQKRYVKREEEFSDIDEKSIRPLSPYETYDNKIINCMRTYEETHHEELSIAYEAYENGKSGELFYSNFRPLDESKMKRFFKRCEIMIVTANPIEKAILHHYIGKKNKKIIRFIFNTNVYYLFEWGKYSVVHVHQHNTGSNKDLGMNTTIHEALKHIRPNVIFSLGVAFGIDHTKQNIGDVIVSHKIFPYSENKRDGEEIIPDRGQDKTIDNWLDVRLANANGFLDEVIYGGMLSGGSVMSSSTEKDRICTAYFINDFIVGGEMEGSGLFQSSFFTDIPCAVIKGICDWGVAKNDIFDEKTFAENGELKEEWFKKSLQAYAMLNVLEKCEPLFRDKTLFSSSKIKAIEREKRKNKFLLTSNLISIICMLLVGIFLLIRFNYSFEKLLIFCLPLFVVSAINIVLILISFFKKKKWKIENYIENKIIDKDLKDIS